MKTKPDMEALKEMAAYLDDGTGVLTAAEIDPRIPTIHEVGPGRRIDTPERVRHLGFGLFKAGDYQFDAGGAMRRAESWSWCPFTGPNMAAVGYDIRAAREAVQEMIDQMDESAT